MATEVFKLVGRITYEGQQKVEAGLSKLGKKVHDVQKNLSDFGDQAKKVGKGFQDVGSTLTKSLTVPLSAAAVTSFKFSKDFNEAMANVATLIPGNTERIKELKKTVQDMAIATGKSTDDLANGLYEVISAFGDSADTATILEINAKAAAAGLAETGEAIALTSAVTKGYGDTSADAVQQVSDLAFQTLVLGQTSFPELADSIGRVTPLAASLKVSQEELFGVMATGTGVTGNAAEVSTQLRGVLQALAAPTDSMIELMAELGFESGEAMMEQLGLQGTIEAIVKAAEESGKPLQDYIGSIQGQTLAMALAGPQADTFTEKLAAMEDVTGATDTAFREQTEGINAAGFQWEQFKQRLIVTAQTLGDTLTPAFMAIMDAAEPLLEWLQQAVDWFANLDPPIQTAIIALGGLLAVTGPLLSIIGTMIVGLGGLAAALGSVSLPVIGVIAGITAIVGSLTAAYAASENFRNIVNTAFGFIKDIITTVMTTVGAFMQEKLNQLTLWWQENGDMIMDAVNNVMTFIQAIFNFVWPFIEALVIGVWNNIKGAIEGAINFILGIFEFFAALFTGDWGALWDAVKKMVSGAVQLIWNVIQLGFLGRIMGVLRGFVSGAINLVSGWVGRIVNFFAGLVSRVVGRANTLRTRVTSVFRRIGDMIFRPIRTARDKIMNAMNRVVSFFRNLGSKLKIRIPKFKLPRFSLQGKFSLAPPSVPKLKVNWYAEGGVFDAASIIGVGEAGTEAVVPLTGDRMRPFAQAIAGEMHTDRIEELLVALIQAVREGKNIIMKDRVVAKIIESHITERQDRDKRRRGRFA